MDSALDNLMKYIICHKKSIYDQLRIVAWVSMFAFAVYGLMSDSMRVYAFAVTSFILFQLLAIIVDSLEYDDSL